MNISWELKKFDSLSVNELYEIIQLRLAIFSVEQNCAYQDADGKDLKSFHLMGRDESGELVVYSRIVPAGISFKEASIGRVVSASKIRGTGSGKKLMQESINQLEKLFGPVRIRIGAQCYLIKFYSSFGFEVAGEEYLEDNIPHIEMIRSVS